MTADRTQHVLDAIDGALGDWSVSGDAMRWSPEPVEPGVWRVDYSHQPEHMRCTVDPVFGYPTLTDAEFVQAYREIVTRACAELGRVFARFAEHLAPVIRHLGELGIVPKPLPTDVRARALELRRTRNTGPERKPAGRQKRPREL